MQMMRNGPRMHTISRLSSLQHSDQSKIFVRSVGPLANKSQNAANVC